MVVFQEGGEGLAVVPEKVASKRSSARDGGHHSRMGGFTPVSDLFLDSYRQLPRPLTTSEAMTVIHLIRFKWTETAPFPSVKTLARKMGISASAVRTHIRTLEEKRYLRRIPKAGASNAFDLEPLFEELETYLKANPQRTRREREVQL